MSELAERARRRQWKPADATVGRPSPNGFLSTRVVGSYSREAHRQTICPLRVPNPRRWPIRGHR